MLVIHTYTHTYPPPHTHIIHIHIWYTHTHPHTHVCIYIYLYIYTHKYLMVLIQFLKVFIHTCACTQQDQQVMVHQKGYFFLVYMSFLLCTCTYIHTYVYTDLHEIYDSLLLHRHIHTNAHLPIHTQIRTCHTYDIYEHRLLLNAT